MPTRSRKTPASLTRPRRVEEPDALGGTPAAEPATPPKTRTRQQRTTPPATEAPPVADAGTGGGDTEPKPRPARRQQSVLFDVDLLDRLRAAITYLSAYEPEAGIHSLPDLINPVVEAAVTDLEKRYNGGQPFRKVARMRTGRRFGT